MSFLQQLYRWLFDHQAAGGRSGDPALTAIDTQKIAVEIGLEEEAKRLGEANLPGPEDTELTGIETRIVRLVEKSRQDLLAWGADQLKILNQEIERRDITTLVNKAAQADKEFERRADSLLAEKEQILDELSTALVQSGTELDDFREWHGLSRQAVYPDRAELFFRFSLLGLLVVVEGVMNAVFFAKGMSSGLVGGFVYAGCFAFGNVLFAYFWGRWLLPNVNHRQALRRFLGILAVPGALGTALMVALVIAHFRDALAHDATDAARAALDTLWQQPLRLREVQSWVLFGVSLSFAMIALADSYGMDDPYPGYGALARRRDRFLEGFVMELENVRRNLQELKDTALGDLDRALADAKSAVHALHETIEHKIAVGMRLRNALADVDNCLDTLLRSFRDLNRMHRRAPPPVYFSVRPRLAELRRPDFSVDLARRKYEQQNLLLGDFIERIEGMRSTIQSSFVRHRDSLKPLDAQFAGRDGEVTP